MKLIALFEASPVLSVKKHISYLRGDAISLEEGKFSNIDNPHDKVSESKHQRWE